MSLLRRHRDLRDVPEGDVITKTEPEIDAKGGTESTVGETDQPTGENPTPEPETVTEPEGDEATELEHQPGEEGESGDVEADPDSPIPGEEGEVETDKEAEAGEEAAPAEEQPEDEPAADEPQPEPKPRKRAAR